MVKLYKFSYFFRFFFKVLLDIDQLLFLRSDDIIRLLEQNGGLLNKSVILF